MGKKRPKPPSAPPPSSPDPPSTTPVEVVYINPLFKLVLLTLLAIFFILLGLAVYLAGVASPTELQKQLFTFCFNGGELILGAIVGLLGGKGIDSFAQRVEK